METKVVNIQVFGRALKLNCPVDEIDALNLAAKDLDERLNELRRKTQILNSDQLIITAALNISYELIKEQAKNQYMGNEFNNRLNNIQKILDNALNTNNQ